MKLMKIEKYQSPFLVFQFVTDFSVQAYKMDKPLPLEIAFFI